MAETDSAASAYQASTGVTPSTLRATLVDVLGATHVDVEDMSGSLALFLLLPSFPTPIRPVVSFANAHSFQRRRLRPDVRRAHRVAAIREEDDAGAAQACERGAEGADQGHPRLDAQVLYT